MRWLANPIQDCEIQDWISQWKIPMFIQWSYRLPPSPPLPYPTIKLTSNLEQSPKLGHSIQSLINTCLFGVHSCSHILFKYRCPIKTGNRVELGTSTFTFFVVPGHVCWFGWLDWNMLLNATNGTPMYVVKKQTWEVGRWEILGGTL